MSRWVVLVVDGPPPKTFDPLAVQPVPASTSTSAVRAEPSVKLPPSEAALPLERASSPESLPFEVLLDEPPELIDPNPLPELLALWLPDDEPPAKPPPEDEPAAPPELLAEVPMLGLAPGEGGLAQATAARENPVARERRRRMGNPPYLRNRSTTS